jgi:hypothetical protein
MEDSGKRQQFDGGAVRDTAEGKPPYSLLPPYAWTALPYGEYVRDFVLSRDVVLLEDLFVRLVKDFGTLRFVRWLELGSQKYSRFNWAKGMYVSRCLDSLGRHLEALKAGLTNEDHAAAVMCNVAFIVHYVREMEAGRLDPKWNDLWI